MGIPVGLRFFLILFFGLGMVSYLGLKTVTGSDPSNKTVVRVDIKLFTFKPGTLDVPLGTTVVWTNGDPIEHSITNGTPDKPGEAFDSGFLTKGETFSFTFSRVGEYPYFCRRHNFMRGVIRVVP
jgi:plastocyanin